MTFDLKLSLNGATVHILRLEASDPEKVEPLLKRELEQMISDLPSTLSRCKTHGLINA